MRSAADIAAVGAVAVFFGRIRDGLRDSRTSVPAPSGPLTMSAGADRISGDAACARASRRTAR